MSEAFPSAPRADRPAEVGGASPIPPSRPPIVRLPMWVNIVLVLILLASCSAAGNAGDAVDSLVGGTGSENAVTDADVRDMCRLLGAVAAAQAVDLDTTFAGGDADTVCETAAREATTP